MVQISNTTINITPIIVAFIIGISIFLTVVIAQDIAYKNKVEFDRNERRANASQICKAKATHRYIGEEKERIDQEEYRDCMKEYGWE